MPVTDQGVNRDRYMLIPRTAIFLRRGDSFLLLKGASTKRLWAEKYNGLGGHVERGEDVLTSARRELFEETGLDADLWLCGIVVVDSGQNPGICLYVFSGEQTQGQLQPSEEGLAEWIDYQQLSSFPVVEDLPILLGRIQPMQRDDPPFAARSFYDEQGQLRMLFA